MKADAGSTIARRDFLKLAGAASLCGLTERAFAADAGRVCVLVDPHDTTVSSQPVRRAVEKLRSAIAARGIVCEVVQSTDAASGSSVCVVVAAPDSALAKGFPRGASLAGAESLRLTPGNVVHVPGILVSARDALG